MMRAILRRKWRHETTGATGEEYKTLIFDCPELEQMLTSGGLNETGFEMTELVGVEVQKPLPTL